MGKLNCFEIFYDQPQGVIFSGGQISGKVIIDLKDGIKLRGIRITLDGYAKVHWSESYTTRHGNSTVTHHSHYNAEEAYFNFCITLWGKTPGDTEGENPVLCPGRYEYPFSAILPVTIPSSFEGGTGHVRYFCKAIVDRPWRFDFTTKKPFTVINHYDLNVQPLARNFARNENQKTLCCLCCTSGPITASASIPRTGYVPGESIPLSAEVNNNSNRTISATKFILKQFLAFHSTTKTKSLTNIIFEASRGPIEPGDSDVWCDFTVPIPPVPASELAGCGIIDIWYQLDFVVIPSGPAINLDVHLPILIGTIPLRDYIPANMSTSTYPSAPDESQFLNIPPPSYEDSMFGASDIRDESDNVYTMGQLSYTPLYPTYKFN